MNQLLRGITFCAWLSIIACNLVFSLPKKTTPEGIKVEDQSIVSLLEETNEVLKAARATIIAQDLKIQEKDKEIKEKDDIIASLTDRAERESLLRRSLEAENASLRAQVKSNEWNRKILLTGLMVGAISIAGVHLYQVWSP